MHCHHFKAGRCRSCDLIEAPYSNQLSHKSDLSRTLLAAYPNCRWLEPVASAPFGFRNKAKMVVSGSVQVPMLGILDGAGQGVDLHDCPLYPEPLQAALARIPEFIRLARIEPYDIVKRRGELKHVLLTIAEHSGDLMLRFVLRSREPLSRIVKHLPELRALIPGLAVASVNLQPVPMAVIEGETEIPLFGETLSVRLNRVDLHLAPRSFFQTNTTVAEALYAQARDWADRIQPRGFWDLYCGVGGFALHCIAPGRRGIGVETRAEAIASARRSAASLNAADAEFLVGDATAFAAAQAHAPDLVIVNPPRRGLGHELCAVLERLAPKWLIYSSCNIESMARDLGAMPGFELVEARLMDMFPQTRHFELIGLIARRDP